MENIKKLQKNYPSFNIIVVNGVRDETNGARGCLLSHQSIVRMAKQKKLPFVCVIEDDCRFIVNNGVLATYVRNITDLFRNNPNIGVVNGCGNLPEPQPIRVVSEQLGMFFLQGVNVTTAHCVFYAESAYDKLLDFDDTHIADVITNKCNMLFTYPYLATQVSSFSDIEKEDVDYQNIPASANYIQALLAKNGHLKQ
jgi:hypothetical protein